MGTAKMLPRTDECLSPQLLPACTNRAVLGGAPRWRRFSKSHARVTLGTECDEIQLGIFARMDCEMPHGEPPSPTSCRTIDTASHRAAAPAAAASRTTSGPAENARLWGESFSGRLLAEVFEERLLLFSGQEFDESARKSAPIISRQ
jgi:hypothetical protein